MKKILIIGSCGAGKSTIAKELSEKLNLPLIGLDQLYWQPGWTRTPREEWRAKVLELVKKDSWIMEGNYQNTFDIRIPAADTIILLDVNRFICFWRIWKRQFLNNRTDKLNGCIEKVDWELVKWVLWDYPEKGRKEIAKFLKQYPDKKIIIIKSKKDLAMRCWLKV
jgi:adenylate kinase family enzyme